MALDTFNPYLFVSAGEQSNKFLTPTYADGIAQFQAQRAQSLTGLTVRIDPIQEGTGDPAPDNIRPISGRTGLTVTRAGKNLFETKNVGRTHNGVTYALQADGKIALTGTADGTSYLYTSPTANALTYIPAGTYTLSGATSVNIRLVATTYEVSGNTVTKIADIATDTGTGASFTLAAESWVGINIRVHSGQATNVSIGMQIEVGNATAYEPYVSQTYPISWQTEAGTIYGGTLDVVSGVLTVDRAIATITRDVYRANWFSHDASYSTWGFYCNNDKRWRDFIGDIPIGGLISDRFSTVITAYTSDSTCCSLQTQNGVMSYMTFRIPKTAIATPTDSNDLSEKIKNWLDSNPIQICFEIEPQTYQLTPTEVRTIAGFNQIYSDAGPVIDIKF